MGQTWSVDGRRLEFRRGKLFVDGVRDEECKVKFSRPNHEFKVGARRLVLKTNGGIGELWSKGILIPLSTKTVPRTAAPEGSRCAAHPDAPAVIACAKCGNFACSACEAVDGTHCTKCMGTFTEADMSAYVMRQHSGLRPLIRYFVWRVLLPAGAVGLAFGIKWLIDR